MSPDPDTDLDQPPLSEPKPHAALVESIADLTGDDPRQPTGVDAESTVYDSQILRNPRVCNNCFRVVRESRQELPETARPSLKRVYRPWHPPDRSTSERDHTGWRCDECGTDDVNARIWSNPSADRTADLARRMARTATDLGYLCDPGIAAETAEHVSRRPAFTGAIDETLRIAFEAGLYAVRRDLHDMANRLAGIEQRIDSDEHESGGAA